MRKPWGKLLAEAGAMVIVNTEGFVHGELNASETDTAAQPLLPSLPWTRCQSGSRWHNDAYRAGVVTLRGAFLTKHRAEILNLALNQEKVAKSARPLHRITAIEDKGEEIEITTTDIHLPRRIGQALHSAYEGKFDFHYDEEGYFIRVNWTRET